MAFDISCITAPLLEWYSAGRRDLPWRHSRDPYRIWVSEIMLQQTRVEAVKPYYARFLEALPDIRALAEAEDENLLKLWEGLGYYSRVRNMKKAAQMICEKHGGVFPGTYGEIRELPGVGDYTAGAVASIAFDLPEPAVDGNVLRVLARLREDTGDMADPKQKKLIAQQLRQIYPKQRCGDFTQSLMELGAVVCVPKGQPLCGSCPLKAVCSAYRNGTWMHYPVKRAKKSRKREKKTILLLRSGDRIAIEKRQATGLLADLWQFPSIDGWLTEEQAAEQVRKLGYEVHSIGEAGRIKHVFTHIEWEMQGYEVQLRDLPPQDLLQGILPDAEESREKGSSLIWVTAADLDEIYSLPSAFRAFIRSAGR